MAAQLRVLLIEDSEDDAELILFELRAAGYVIDSERVYSAEDVQSALSRRGWDIVICDYNLPGFSAAGALRLLKESELDLPFILVSGTVPENEAIAAMKSGARD